MRIIKEQFLREAVPPSSKTGKWLESWRLVVRAAEWSNLGDVRKTYPSADAVKTESGRSVTGYGFPSAPTAVSVSGR